MTTPFDQYAAQGNQILARVANELSIPSEKERALNVLKAVLHAIRNRISPEESAQFIAQLPMMMKAVYVDGWQIGKHQTRVSTFEDFVSEVFELGGAYKAVAFIDRMEVEKSIMVVFNVLKSYVSEGEFKDVLAAMPAKLRADLEVLLMSNGGLVL